MSFTNFTEAELLDHLLGGNTAGNVYTPPATVYVGLSTADPTEDGSGIVEPVGNGYARVAVPNTSASWSAATGTPTTKSNTGAISFNPASDSWGTLTHFFIADAPTNGNILLKGALATPKQIGGGDTASFAAGDIDVTLD
jgi:hypothetical protein